MPENTVVCFDLGGVLLQICHNWRKACQVAGLSTPGIEEVPLTLTDIGSFVAYQTGAMTDEEYSIQLGKALGLSREDALRAHDAVILTDYPGAFELVTDLKAHGFFTCCFSNTNRRHWHILEDATLHPAIAALNVRIASHVIGLSKPAPEAFVEVAHLLGNPKEIVFFDDIHENVIGASDAGWQAFHIDPKNDPPAQIRRTLAGIGVMGDAAGSLRP